jgi:hypothetical protein
MAEHLITPPPELVEQWVEYAGLVGINEHQLVHLATQAARWGADQQLELDARWLDHNALNETHLKITPIGDVLKEAMRLEPPSLKEQALIELGDVYNRDKIDDVTYDTIRLALEQLDD